MRTLPATTATTPLRVAAPIPRQTLRGPGSVLAMPSGCIASDLRMVNYDARQRKYVYELLLVNDTVAPVAAYAYLDARASGGMRAWNAVTVDPFAAIAVTVDVPLGKKKEDVRQPSTGVGAGGGSSGSQPVIH